MLKDLVAAKQGAPGDDLVSALIGARDGDERLDNQELLSTIFQLIVAGHDTTASLIGNGVVALFRNPAQLAELRRDPDKMAAAIEELLRYDAPVPHSTFRYAVEPVTLGGVTIPAGAQVIICLAAANRDEDKFASPESLDVDRAVDPSPRLRARRAPLSRRPAGPYGGPGRARPRCWDVSQSWPSPSPRRICTGGTVTAWCCAACPSSRSSPAPPCRGPA